MQLSDLVKRLEGAVVHGPVDRKVTDICYDSRRAGPGSLFVAVRGELVDGHSFIVQAINKGAVAVVTEVPGLLGRATTIVVKNSRETLAQLASVFYDEPSQKLRMIGITGTNGKTTTAFLVKYLLERAGQSTGLIGTVQYEIGEHLLPAERTTPESLDLQKLLSQCIDAGCRSVVMEVSSHALRQGRVAEIAFDAAAFTNFTQDHLDFHRGMDDYFEAKVSLFGSLHPKHDKQPVAVINIDDSYGQKIVARFGRDLPMITYGMGGRADFRASNCKIELGGTSYRLDAKDKSYLVRLPLIGRFNIYNSLAALALAHAVDVDIRTSVFAMAEAPQIPGRLEAVRAKRRFQVYVDYAHTDDALLNVLKTCRDLNPNRLIVVFGCGGNRDKAKRAKMGNVADQYADYAIITSDNPRKEDPEAIIDDIEAGFRRKNYERVVDRKRAIAHAIGMAQPRDIILIAGKGHEKYQEFSDHTIPFDDVEVASRALEEHPVELTKNGL
jgi:UDP-N-acetylmuramoyl-L-alanyl-D-glutamate--2,6-diaminopimelate ligase